MSKTIKVVVPESGYEIIANEASSRLLSVPAFVRLCIASFVNKGSQRRVFQKSEPTDDKEKKSGGDPK